MVYAHQNVYSSRELIKRMQEECDRWPPTLWKPTVEEEQATKLKYRDLSRANLWRARKRMRNNK